MVLTIGEFSTNPAMHGITKVPGEVSMTIDMRSIDDEILDRFDRFLNHGADRIASDRSVEIDLGSQTRAAPAQMSVNLQKELMEAGDQIGLECLSMPSGGGHDCATFAGLGVPTGMIFIRNRNGSHNPGEHMAFEDFVCAADTLTAWATRCVSARDT